MDNEAEIRKRKIYRVTFIGFVVNLALSCFKLAAGVLGRSAAMTADAVHSFSDMATDVVVIAFARISAKPKDDGHDYGHGKYETLATIIISLALVAVGVGILLSSMRSIRTVIEGGVLPRPGGVALIAAVLSIVAKEILYRYTVRVGRAIDSPSVVANAAMRFRRLERWSASAAPFFSERSGVSPIRLRRSLSPSSSSRSLSI